MTYFTAGEQCLSRKHRKEPKEMTWGMLAAIYVMLILLTIVYFIIPTTPSVEAQAIDTHYVGDRVQEQTYCREWNQSKAIVTNADNMAVAAHCKKYL